MIAKFYEREFYCTIGAEKFTTWTVSTKSVDFDKFYRMWSSVNYENLNAFNKTKILKAYKLHQDRNKQSDFISLSRLDRWLVNEPISRSWIDEDNDA